MNKEEILKALEEIRKQEARKFKQSVDLIINLKNFDIKRESVNLIVNLPHKIGEVKIAAFFTSRSKLLDTITKDDFAGYKTKKDIKKLVRSYDFFIAQASLMPAIASAFGKYLGPAGKMPSPQLGIIPNDNEANIKEVLEKASRALKVKTKEPSIKLAVGREEMKNEDIAENALAVYNPVLNALPRKNDNIRSVLIKFTMGKPVKIGK
jgi:large subunit ribosomal protein L1